MAAVPATLDGPAQYADLDRGDIASIDLRGAGIVGAVEAVEKLGLGGVR